MSLSWSFSLFLWIMTDDSLDISIREKKILFKKINVEKMG